MSRSKSDGNGKKGDTPGLPTLSRQTTIPRREEGSVLITGGAGFIGTNLAHRLLLSQRRVVLYDNMLRAGVERNVSWLRSQHGDRLQVVVADVRDRAPLSRAVQSADQVFHLAAQVAVTTSLTSPFEDFQINLLGTLNLLEVLRHLDAPPPLVFTSTNKVYGGLEDIELRATRTRYEPCSSPRGPCGIAENRSLDFQSPYGCSKGAADQYVLEYARTFGIPAVVFRMSCIYGPHQFGTEDQGWVAHFLIRALEGRPITIYGDGKQVRDVLFAEDLVDALLLAQANMSLLSGQAFNIGGGPENATSLAELLHLIQGLHGIKALVEYSNWRPADQRYYVSDFTKFKEATGWTPRFCVQEGIERVYRWLVESGNHHRAAMAGKNAPAETQRDLRSTLPLAPDSKFNLPLGEV
jgi:CDP-paratose 2-epimerase